MKNVFLIAIILFCSCSRKEDSQPVPVQPIDSPKVAVTYRYAGQLRAYAWVQNPHNIGLDDSLNASIPDTAFLTVDTNNVITATLRVFRADEGDGTFPYITLTVPLNSDSVFTAYYGPRYTTTDTAKLFNHGHDFYWNIHTDYDVRGALKNLFSGILL